MASHHPKNEFTFYNDVVEVTNEVPMFGSDVSKQTPMRKEEEYNESRHDYHHEQEKQEVEQYEVEISRDNSLVAEQQQNAQSPQNKRRNRSLMDTIANTVSSSFYVASERASRDIDNFIQDLSGRRGRRTYEPDTTDLEEEEGKEKQKQKSFTVIQSTRRKPTEKEQANKDAKKTASIQQQQQQKVDPDTVTEELEHMLCFASGTGSNSGHYHPKNYDDDEGEVAKRRKSRKQQQRIDPELITKELQYMLNKSIGSHPNDEEHQQPKTNQLLLTKEFIKKQKQYEELMSSEREQHKHEEEVADDGDNSSRRTRTTTSATKRSSSPLHKSKSLLNKVSITFQSTFSNRTKRTIGGDPDDFDVDVGDDKFVVVAAGDDDCNEKKNNNNVFDILSNTLQATISNRSNRSSKRTIGGDPDDEEDHDRNEKNSNNVFDKLSNTFQDTFSNRSNRSSKRTVGGDPDDEEDHDRESNVEEQQQISASSTTSSGSSGSSRRVDMAGNMAVVEDTSSVIELVNIRDHATAMRAESAAKSIDDDDETSHDEDDLNDNIKADNSKEEKSVMQKSSFKNEESRRPQQQRTNGRRTKKPFLLSRTDTPKSIDNDSFYSPMIHNISNMIHTLESERIRVAREEPTIVLGSGSNSVCHSNNDDDDKDTINAGHQSSSIVGDQRPPAVSSQARILSIYHNNVAACGCDAPPLLGVNSESSDGTGLMLLTSTVISNENSATDIENQKSNMDVIEEEHKRESVQETDRQEKKKNSKSSLAKNIFKSSHRTALRSVKEKARENYDPIIQDLANGKVTCHTGTFPSRAWFQDWKFYILNTHPLISICTAHPLHPFSKCERLMVLLCGFGMAFWWACVESTLPPDSTYIISWIIAPITLTVLYMMLQTTATCSCLRGKSIIACLLRPVADAASSFALCWALRWTITFVVLGLIVVLGWPGPYSSEDPDFIDGGGNDTNAAGQIFADLCIPQCLSWVYAFPMSALFYGWKRRGEWKDSKNYGTSDDDSNKIPVWGEANDSGDMDSSVVTTSRKNQGIEIAMQNMWEPPLKDCPKPVFTVSSF